MDAPWAEATSAAVAEACAAANIPIHELCFAQIKCPLLTPERVTAAAAAAAAAAATSSSTAVCATDDCYHSMALSRGASSLGVALATGEISSVSDDDVCRDYSKSSSVASSSAGIELMHCEVIVLGNAPGSRSKLRASADPAASVRGRRTTMLSDSDINATRHARAAVGGTVACAVGDARVYVSGGAEHQGPEGGGPVCVVYDVERAEEAAAAPPTRC